MQRKFTILLSMLVVSIVTTLVYLPGDKDSTLQIAHIVKRSYVLLTTGQPISIQNGTLTEKRRNKTQTNTRNKTFNDITSDRVIRILTWTKRSMYVPYWFGRKTEGLGECNTPIPCQYSNNHALYNVSDVILFFTSHAHNQDAFPSYRLPNQHWMTYLREAPTRTFSVKAPYKSWFNWTIAYTMNAHIVRPYGICLPRKETVERDPTSITDVTRRVYGERAESMPWTLTQKSRNTMSMSSGKRRGGLVLWAVSNCKTPSQRELYVKELKRHIKVDIVGKCAGLACGKRGTPPCKFRNGFFGYHKFYLSFENSLCPDYITEKVWTRLERGIIPIVLGNADYNSYLPKHSYIDVRDFPSPQHLAAYLHKLDKNDTLYNEYFTWKRDYTCHFELPENDLLCDVCRFMNKKLNSVNAIDDINRFWNRKNCLSPVEYYNGIVNDVV